MWKTILEAIKAKGYTGKDYDLAAVRKFLADNGINLLDGKTNKTVDLDDAHTKAVNITVKSDNPTQDQVTLNGQALEPAASGEGEPTDETAEPTAKSATGIVTPEQFRAARAASNGVAYNAATKAAFGAPAVHAGEQHYARKRYTAKIKDFGVGRPDKGKAAFDDVDTAERFGAWFRLVANVHKFGGLDYAQKRRDMEIVGKTGLTTVNTTGGALVDPEFSKQIIWLSEQYGVAKKLAMVYPMSSNEWIGKRRTSIVTFNPTAEGATATAQDNGYDNIELYAKKCLALVKLSNELFADTSPINLADEYAQAFAEGRAYAIDDHYFNGDGSATYNNHVGLKAGLPSGAYLTATAGWANYTPGDILKLAGSIQNVGQGQVIKYVSSRQFFVQVAQTKQIATSQFKDFIGGPVGDSDASFMGYPWYFAQVLPQTTDSTSGSKFVYAGAFAAGSAIGDREDLRINESDDVYFADDAKALRASTRFAINIHGDGRASTVGPIACLSNA